MTVHWAIDLGTSNTVVCEDRSGRPRVAHLPDLARVELLTQTPVIPTCVCVLDEDATQVLIGQEALTYNWDGQATGFARAFKPLLDTEAQRSVAHVGRRSITAQDAAELYVQRLVRSVEELFDTRVEDLTIATPSGFYETYRAELLRIARRIHRTPWWKRLWGRLRRRPTHVTFRTVDEPVAAALGYGIDVGRAATLVAFDFGAGSMEAAAIRTSGPDTLETGRAEVLAKQAVPLGGNDVDTWILERFVPRALHDWPEWEVALRWEAERVKLLASAGGEADFVFRNETYGRLDHGELGMLLAERGLYRRIDELLDALLEELDTRHGLGAEAVEDVILEGGSTLLPGVRDAVGGLLGRDKIREWLPFEAVARGACIFASGAEVEDFIYHDYALRVLPAGGEEAEYELLIPAGTRFPTPSDFVTRYYAPGFDGQREINLFVCEVGRIAGQRVTWRERDGGGRVFTPASPGERAFCVCLNEADPAFALDPPGRGDAPRLRVTYSVDAQRWLCVTVHDLQRKEDLAVQQPVVRLR